MAGVAGRPFQIVLGPGDCCAADAPQTAERARAAKAPPAENQGGGGGGEGGGLAIQGVPIVKPPYGVIAAVDLDKGQLKWQTPHGDTPDAVRNSPALRGITIPKTGQAQTSGVGLLVTKTLVIMGDPISTTTPEHPRGAMLRAYDKATGRQVGAILMPAQQSGSPMTYMVDGKQYIIVAVSDARYSGEYLAFALPN
jgi:quinoprotein glucose dehydrogenase